MTFSPQFISPSASSFSTPPRQLGGVHSRLLSSDYEPAWAKTVRERLDVLCALQQGWDGYKARGIHFTTAWFAMKLLENSCARSFPAPDIVPGPSGDLQIEWHTDSGDIEVHVKKPNDVNAWRSNAFLGEDGEEIILINNFTILKRWIDELLGTRLASAA